MKVTSFRSITMTPPSGIKGFTMSFTSPAVWLTNRPWQRTVVTLTPSSSTELSTSQRKGASDVLVTQISQGTRSIVKCNPCNAAQLLNSNDERIYLLPKVLTLTFVNPRYVLRDETAWACDLCIQPCRSAEHT